MGAVGEDVDLRLRVLPDEGAGGADGLAEPVGQIARVGVPNRRQRLLPVVLAVSKETSIFSSSDFRRCQGSRSRLTSDWKSSS